VSARTDTKINVVVRADTANAEPAAAHGHKSEKGRAPEDGPALLRLERHGGLAAPTGTQIFASCCATYSCTGDTSDRTREISSDWPCVPVFWNAFDRCDRSVVILTPMLASIWDKDAPNARRVTTSV
jgi:hypothetical protein